MDRVDKSKEKYKQLYDDGIPAHTVPILIFRTS